MPQASSEPLNHGSSIAVRQELRPVPERLVVVALFTIFMMTAWLSLGEDSPTFDEPTHLVSGFSYLDKADFRLNPEHPPLAKMWAALPLFLSGVESISPTSVRWRLGRQRELGFEFVHGSFEHVERWDPAIRLVPARTAMVLMGVVLGVVVFAWAREMWGPAGALTALALFAFSPTMLAHTRLVTTDVPAALGFTTVLWSLWRFCRVPTWLRGLELGVAMGIALLLKFSTLLLAPMVGALLALWVMWPSQVLGAARQRLLVGATTLGGAAVIAFLILWAGYGFRYRAVAVDQYALPWSEVMQRAGIIPDVIQFLRAQQWLPESYLYGLAYVVGHSDRRTFLNGEILPHGSWLYFPEAFVLKTTPALLAIVLWMIAAAILRRRWSLDGWFVAIPIVIYVAVSVWSRLNIGHRHLLPIYPLLFVWAGYLGRVATTSRPAAIVLMVILSSHALSSVASYPRYLSYFNAFAGGPDRGWHSLVDSNIDWGQDLGRLGAWMKEQHVPQVFLAYFGSGDPGSYGITFRKVYQVEDFEPGIRHRAPLPGEYVAASVTLLQGLYVSDPDVASWLARLRTELQPVGKAGDSILIYRLP